MGEYAKRTCDGAEVKLGTCESMYYCRWEQRNDVTQLRHSLDPRTQTDLHWRLPYADEDGEMAGGYSGLKHDRGYRLSPKRRDNRGCDYYEDICGDLPGEPGFVQVVHPSGLLLSIPCHHGQKLPGDTPEGWSVGWNGRTWHIELIAVKNLADGTLQPIIGCRFCGKSWSCDWEEVLPCVPDEELHRRLEIYAKHGR